MTAGRRNASPSPPDIPRPSLVSHDSDLLRLGVPVGVLLTLSTRVCLEPERGVTLFRKVDTGVAKSSRWDALLLGVVAVAIVGPLLRADSGRGARLGSGVATVTVCLEATLGVRGARAARPLAKVGIWGVWREEA